MNYTIGKKLYRINYVVIELGKEYQIWLENIKDDNEYIQIQELSEEEQNILFNKVNLDALEALDQVGYL